MDYRRVGRTGLKVSEICLGTMTFGHGADQAETDRIVGTSLDAGVTFFDTADGYNAGQSEIMLGKALGSRRKQTVIASKVFNPTGPGPNDSGMSRSHILDNIESSLKRLGTDYLDLYYIHPVDIETPLDEMLRAFDDLVRQGKVRYIACSNYEAWRLMEAMWISDSRGLERFACHQPQHRQIRAALHAEADQRIDGREGGLQLANVVSQRGGAVHEGGGAGLVGDGCKRHAFAVQVAILEVEVIHGRVSVADSRRGVRPRRWRSWRRRPAWPRARW